MTPPRPDSCTPDPRRLLSLLAAGQEIPLQDELVPVSGDPVGLDRRTRLLVWLAALLCIGASAETLHWAVERVCAAGVDDAAIMAAFQATATIAGAAQLVANAPRLALALGFDVEN